MASETPDQICFSLNMALWKRCDYDNDYNDDYDDYDDDEFDDADDCGKTSVKKNLQSLEDTQVRYFL